jgi:vitamin B12 transporter
MRDDDCTIYQPCPRQRRRSALIGAALTTIATAAPALAEPETQMLPDTVVSANRVEVPSREVGSAVTVITGEEMEARQIRVVADALRDVPGVSVNRTGPRGLLTQVRIRGNEGNHTKVFIDGVEANAPAGDFEFDFANLLAADIERIEVIRGPQSAIWGSDAIGGVINVITKRGESGTRANGFLEAGSFETYAGNAAFSGAGKNYRYFAGGSFYKTQGVNMSRFGTESDGYKNGTLNLSGAVDPTDTLELSINGTYIANNVQSDPQSFATGLFFDGDQERKGEQFYGRAQGKWKTFDGQWQHIFGGNYTYTDFENFVDKALSSSNSGSKSRLDYQSNIFLTTPDIADHTVTVYAEYAHETFENRSVGFAASNQNQSRDSASVAGEYLVGLWRRLFLTGSLRYDANEDFKNASTYRFTGAYVHAESGSKLHGSVGTGIKNPGFFEQFGFVPGPPAFDPNPNLRPEKSNGWDVGYEQKFFANRLVMDLTYFSSVLTDEIALVPSPTMPGATTVINQTGKSNRQGIEFSAKAALREDLTMTAAYTWLDSTDPSGNVEVRRPRQIASLVFDYLLPARRGNVNLNIQYNGEMEDFDFSTFPATRRTLDAYTLVNLAGAYNIDKRVQLFARIENLLDQDYEEVWSARSPGIGFFAGVRVNAEIIN